MIFPWFPMISIPWSPNAPNAWSPYQHAPAYRPRKTEPGESLFIARQLEYIRPGLYDIELSKVESMKLIPLNVEFCHTYGPARDGSRVSLMSAPRSFVRTSGAAPSSPPARRPDPSPLTETWTPSGAVAVTGTLAQVIAWFEARGCEVRPDRKPMRDASGYRIKAADGRWVCDFIAYWRSGRCTAHCDWGRENRDPGDE